MLTIDNKKESIIFHSLWAVTFVALMIVAAFYDLSINQALSNPTSLFPRFFNTLGEFPAYMIIPVTATIMFYVDWGLKKHWSIIVKVAFAALVYVGFIIWGFFGGMDIQSKGMVCLYSILLAMGALFVGNMMDRDTAKKLVKWCLFAICVLIVTLLATRLLKMIWGRVRYRDLMAMSSTDAFTPWYKINGWDMDNHSFPSGHTTSACNIFVFVLLFEYSVKNGKFKRLAYVIAFLFTVLTGLSRIVGQAHYLSDVLVGGTLSYALYYLAKTIFFRHKNFAFMQKSSIAKGNKDDQKE